TCSTSTHLSAPSIAPYTLSRAACILFDELWHQSPIRLLGIRTSKLVSDDTPVQMSIFDYPQNDPAVPKAEGSVSPSPADTKKQRQLEQALDSIRQKYGRDAVQRGSFLKQPPKKE